MSGSEHRPSGPGSHNGSNDADVGQLMAVGRRLILSQAVHGSLHDFNNSLQIISGLAELLLRRGGLPVGAADKLETIAERTVRAAAAVTRLQMLSRPAEGRARDTDLRQLATEVLELRRYAMSRLGLSGRLEPGDGRPCLARADPDRLRLALIGLVWLAEESPGEGAGGEVVVSADRIGDRVRVDVSVAGGLDVERTRRALDAEPTGLDGGPVGVVLRLARAVAIAEHGSLTLVDRATDAEGALMRLELPAAV